MTPVQMAAVVIVRVLKGSSASKPVKFNTYFGRYERAGGSLRDMVDAEKALLENGVISRAFDGRNSSIWLTEKGAKVRNPTRRNIGDPSHRIDTAAGLDRRTGKRADVQKALARIAKANDLGFFLDNRGWYRQDRDEHFVESVGRGGRQEMAGGTRYRKYLSAAESAHLNAFVAGKGRL